MDHQQLQQWLPMSTGAAQESARVPALTSPPSLTQLQEADARAPTPVPFQQTPFMQISQPFTSNESSRAPSSSALVGVQHAHDACLVHICKAA